VPETVVLAGRDTGRPAGRDGRAHGPGG
jgi:hypothetical protein